MKDENSSDEQRWIVAQHSSATLDDERQRASLVGSVAHQVAECVPVVAVKAKRTSDSANCFFLRDAVGEVDLRDREPRTTQLMSHLDRVPL